MKITTFPTRLLFLRQGIGVCYKEKDNKLVLKTETHWSKINGIWINSRWGCWWFEFRRYE